MKLQELQSLLTEQRVNMLLLLHPDPNLNYLAQVHTSHAVLQITKNSATLHVSTLDKIAPRDGIRIAEYKKTWKEELKTVLQVFKNPKIAINKAQLTIKQFEQLQKSIPNTDWIDFSEELQDLRLQKTEEELQIMFEAAEIADNALASFVNAYRKDSGQFPTELSVALFLEAEVRKQGATLSFPTIVATKENAAIPHHVTSTTKLKKGLLLIDMGAKYKGYCSDMTRMFSIGEPTSEEQADFDLLFKVQEACVKKAAEMAETQDPLGSLDAFAKKQLGDKEKAFIHSLGHGIGTEVHEAPRVAKNSSQTIQRNMPFTIEPGIYFKGKWGLRIEDTVIWDGKTIQRLTKSSKELIIL